MRALIVDDSSATRAAIRRMMGQLGFDCVEAKHGLDALETLQDDEVGVDVALIDWNMPEMDGLALVKAMRRERRFAALPVVMVTAETSVVRMAQSLAAGADEYVMKPVTLDVLSSKLALLGFEELPCH